MLIYEKPYLNLLRKMKNYILINKKTISIKNYNINDLILRKTTISILNYIINIRINQRILYWWYTFDTSSIWFFRSEKIIIRPLSSSPSLSFSSSVMKTKINLQIWLIWSKVEHFVDLFKFISWKLSNSELTRHWDLGRLIKDKYTENLKGKRKYIRRRNNGNKDLKHKRREIGNPWRDE